MTKLTEKKCKACEGGIPPLGLDRINSLANEIPEWKVETLCIFRDFKFKNYYQTMAFVNAIAWISHQENHHPDLAVGYNHCRVQYSTHAIQGLSENDFICAAKVDKLLSA